MESKQGTGIVKGIYPNRSKHGEPYVGVVIDGARYTAFEQDVIAELVPGERVQFAFEERGQFRNITQAKRVENAGSPEPWWQRERDDRIGRQVALKAAAEIVAQRSVGPEEAAEATLVLANRLVAWIRKS